MLRSKLSGIVAAAALAASALVGGAPAQAAPGDVVINTPPTAVLQDISCVDHPFTYSVELPAGTTDWFLLVELYGPDNARHTAEYIGTTWSSPTSGEVAVQLCSGSEPLGTYSLLSTLQYKVGDNPTVFGEPILRANFEAVGKAKSKVKLSAKKKGPKVKAKAKVIFQKKVGKKWKKADVAKTNAEGIAKGSFKAKGRTTIRAVFKGAGEVLVGNALPVPPATSKPKTLR